MTVVVLPTPPFWLATATMRAMYWSNDLLSGVRRQCFETLRQQDTELSDRRQSFCSTWNTTAEAELAWLGPWQKLKCTNNFPRFSLGWLRSEKRKNARKAEQYKS